MAHKRQGGQKYRPIPKPINLLELATIDAVRNRPELARLIGVLCDEWSNTEVCLALMFDAFLGGSGMDVIEVFEQVLTLKHKVEMLKKLARRRLSDTNVRSVFVDILDEILRLGKRRAHFIHARWGILPINPDDLVYLPIHQRLIAEAHFIGAAELEPLIQEIKKHRLTSWTWFDATIKPILGLKSDLPAANQKNPDCPVEIHF